MRWYSINYLAIRRLSGFYRRAISIIINQRKKLLLLLMFLSVFSCRAHSVQQEAPNQTLLVLSHPFPPWQFFNKKTQQVEGINVDIVKYIFAQMEIPVTFVEQPWSSAWTTIKKGHAEAIMSTSRKQAREPYLWYPQENLWLSEYVFFVKKENKRADFLGTYQEMKASSVKIGVVNGYSYHASFWSEFPYRSGGTRYIPEKRDYHQQVYGVRTPELLFKMLSFNRMDVVINDKSIGSYLINSHGLQDSLTYYDHILFSKGYPMPFAKMSGYPNLKTIADRFEQRLTKIKQNGRYQQLVDTWLMRHGLAL